MMCTRWMKITVLSLAVLLLFAGCNSAGEVMLEESDNGGQISLEIGQILSITLPSNPTTGYSWEAIALEQAILAQSGNPEYVSEAEGDLVGAGGTETFRFEAVASGEAQLTLIYHRQFEEGVEPIDTFSVTVEVR
jgi:inhibitor of cysteine peptidase